MSARIPNYHQAAGALHHEIPLLRFVNETVFRTKAGSFGMVLRASGIDPECRLDEDLESYARRIEKAMKTFDERFRVYQYISNGSALRSHRKANIRTKEQANLSAVACWISESVIRRSPRFRCF